MAEQLLPSTIIVFFFLKALLFICVEFVVRYIFLSETIALESRFCMVKGREILVVLNVLPSTQYKS